MKTKYKGVCFVCKKEVPAGDGHFQSVGGMSKKQQARHSGKRWLVRCLYCVGKTPGYSAASSTTVADGKTIEEALTAIG